MDPQESRIWSNMNQFNRNEGNERHFSEEEISILHQAASILHTPIKALPNILQPVHFSKPNSRITAQGVDLPPSDLIVARNSKERIAWQFPDSLNTSLIEVSPDQTTSQFNPEQAGHVIEYPSDQFHAILQMTHGDPIPLLDQPLDQHLPLFLQGNVHSDYRFPPVTTSQYIQIDREASLDFLFDTETVPATAEPNLSNFDVNQQPQSLSNVDGLGSFQQWNDAWDEPLDLSELPSCFDIPHYGNAVSEVFDSSGNSSLQHDLDQPRQVTSEEDPTASSSSAIILTPKSSLSNTNSLPRPHSDTPETIGSQRNEVIINGPCSHVWKLPPRTRRKKRSEQANEVPKSLVVKAQKVQRQRGSFQDRKKRDATARTRIIGACMRCRFYRVRCVQNPDDEKGSCLRCLHVKRQTLTRLPCLRYLIADASLYREQDAPFHLFTKRWKSMDIQDIVEWASPETKTIEVTQDFGVTSWKLVVRKFVPLPGDMLQEKWSDGLVEKYHDIPPYGILDMGKTAHEYRKFVDHNFLDYVSHGALSYADELFRITYTMTVKCSREAQTQEERTLLVNALRLWVSARLCSYPERICGSETLGIAAVHDPSSIFDLTVPIPPVMGAQIEVIVYSELLRPYSKAVLRQLTDLIMAKKHQKYWLTTYLTIFILLHSCSMTTRRDEEYARQIMAPDKYANRDSIEAHHMGAHILLAHFHFINKGKCPFQLALESSGIQELAERGELNAEQVQFVRDTALLVKDKSDMLKTARESRAYGDDFYFVSQLFDNDWKPPPSALKS